MLFLCFLFAFLLTSLPSNYVRSISTTATISPHVGSRNWRFMSPVNPLIAPAPSLAPQGPVPGPTIVFPRRHRRHRRVRTRPVSPSPSTEPGCGQICVEPLTSAIVLSPCGCVLPMKVRLVLQVSLYAIFPVVRDLAMEIAEGTYVHQKQVSINGASADPLTPENSVVDINLIPLEEKFDNTTAMFICTRLLKKKVHLNHSLFGDYEVIYISYPGLPSTPPLGVVSGNGPTGSVVGGQQFPITADFVNKSQKLSPRVIFVIGSSAFVLLVVCCGAIVILLKCKKAGRPSTSVGPAFAPSIYKRSGVGSIVSSSPASSSSTSLVSGMPVSLVSVKTFSLAELRKATDKFSSKKVLGEGGFGRVYLGILGDGSEVAVKLLTRDTNQNGEREFIGEVEMLSRLHHRNLVKLIGICMEERTRCLVYELVSNGNVESHLHGGDKGKGKGSLDWDARLKIALGAARGLAYLHEDSNPRVIHRDFKASNVLLEDDFTPKVSDFGLAREATEGSHHISTRVMGTFGYVAPEYAMTGHLLVKSDVYSYGVVLLELLTGRKPVDMSQPPGQENLVTWARPLLTTREGVHQLVDPLLAGTYNFDDMAKVAAIASMCVHTEVTHRPFMGEVVQALKLIYNDADQDDAHSHSHSHRESSLSGRASDFKGDMLPSDSSWWNAAAVTPQLRYAQPSSFITMDYSSGPLDDFDKRHFPSSSAFTSGRLALPIKHANRSGPLKTVRTNPAFQRLQGSTSEHGGFLSKRAWNDVQGSDASF